MTDEYKNNLGDEEYQFPNDEYTAPSDESHEAAGEKLPPEGPQTYSQLGMSSGGGLSILRNKRVWMIVGVVVVAFIGFKIIGSSGSNTQQLAKQSEPKPAQQVVAPNPEVMNQIAGLQQGELKEQDSVQKLQAQVEQLHSSLNTANSANEQLSQSVEALASQLKQLGVEIKTQPKKQVAHKKVVPQAPRITYHLVAVVPGRAWIENNYGKSQTVRVGDVLTQYGEVQAISANRGLILTSSGKVIQYGENDS